MGFEKIKITIPLAPVSKKNSMRIATNRATGRPILLQSKNYLEYEKAAGYFLKPLGIDYPVNVKANFYTKTRRRVDLTNLENAIADVLVKYNVLTDDNRNIIYSMDGSRVFYDKKNPRTEIEITRIPESEFEKWDIK